MTLDNTTAVQISVYQAVALVRQRLASLPEGGGTAYAVTEGMSDRKNDTPPASLCSAAPSRRGPRRLSELLVKLKLFF